LRRIGSYLGLSAAELAESRKSALSLLSAATFDMTAPDERSPGERRPRWLGFAATAAIGVMVALSVAIYLGLAARGSTWPLFVLAVASAPLALLAVAQGVQAVVSLGRHDGGDGDK
jgi:hypothetical protein